MTWSSAALAAEPESRAYDGPGAMPATADATRVEEAPAALVPTRAPERSRPAEHVEPPPPAAVRPRAEPRHEVRARWGLDLALTLGVAAPTAAMGLWVQPSLPDNVPAPGTDPGVGRFDRLALGRFENGPKVVSDVLLAVSIGTPLAYHAAEAALQRRGYSRARGRGFLARYGTDLLLIAEAIAINALITEILKTAIRRPRPYTFMDPAEVPASERQALIDAQTGTQANWSFPSGHTSTAFTATTAGATLLTLELLGRSPWAIACAWVGGTGLAATTGIMRVMAGRHFPSDVVTSALLGIGVGIAVPLAHWKPTPVGDRVDRRRERNFTLAPYSGTGVFGLRIAGTFR